MRVKCYQLSVIGNLGCLTNHYHNLTKEFNSDRAYRKLVYALYFYVKEQRMKKADDMGSVHLGANDGVEKQLVFC